MKFFVVPESSERCTGVISLLGQLGVGVVGLDRRVVPLGDLALEDAADGLGREVQLVDAVEVVDDGDGADVDRDLDDVALAALLGLGELLVVQVGVRTGDREAAGDELLAAAARADRVVVDGDVGVRGLEVLLPGGDCGLLGARSAGVQRAGHLGAGVGRAGVIGFVRCTAGAEAEGECERGRGGGDAQ